MCLELGRGAAEGYLLGMAAPARGIPQQRRLPLYALHKTGPVINQSWMGWDSGPLPLPVELPVALDSG